MTDESRSHRDLLEVTWVHLFEQDTPEGSVFVRFDSDDIPLSRRPRMQLVLQRDGTATIGSGGFDDRPSARSAEWTEEDRTIVVRTADGREAMRVLRHSPNRLLVKLPVRDV